MGLDRSHDNEPAHVSAAKGPQLSLQRDDWIGPRSGGSIDGQLLCESSPVPDCKIGSSYDDQSVSAGYSDRDRNERSEDDLPDRRVYGVVDARSDNRDHAEKAFLG